jgi:hypothetical protein
MTTINTRPELSTVTEDDLLLIWNTETSTTRKVKLSVLKAYCNPVPTQTGKTLTYSSAGDSNGLFYWLGSRGGTWSNPLTSQVISAVISSLQAGSLSQLCDRQSNSPGIVTNNSSNSWILIDIGARKLKCNAYTLRHRDSTQFPGYYLRNWKLQGTNVLASMSISDINNATWTDLDVRTSNTSINSNAGWGYFTVAENPSEFTYWRLIQTGINSSNSHELMLGEIEIYGILTE